MSEQGSAVRVRPFRKEDLEMRRLMNLDVKSRGGTVLSIGVYPQDLEGCERWF